MAAEIFELEPVADELARSWSDDHGARRAQRLGARSEVGRLAHDTLSVRERIAFRLADHDQTRRDPRSSHERRTRADRQPADGLHQLECRPHRSLGVVLVRPRPAEVDDRTVAEELGDVAAPPLDDLLAAVVIGGHRHGEVLRIEAARKLGRSDEVAEDDRDLTTLGAGRRLAGSCFGGGAVSEAGDRSAEPLAIAERNAEPFKILVRELRQDVELDSLLLEERHVLRQADRAQPVGDVAYPIVTVGAQDSWCRSSSHDGRWCRRTTSIAGYQRISHRRARSG